MAVKVPATSITLTIEAAPTVDPGLPATICEGDSYTLSNAIVSNNNGLIWTTSGDGQFDNNNILNPIYTPGPNDIINGSVNLTLTANGNSPCSNISASMVLTITPGAIAEADQIIIFVKMKILLFLQLLQQIVVL